VTVKLRAGMKPGGTEGGEVARRLVEDAGVAGLTFHPRSAAVRHKGAPDYELAARLVAELPVPVLVSGGMEGAEHVRWVFEHTGCAAVMLARGSLGNPWLFSQVLDDAATEPGPEEVLAEWGWVVDRCVEHLGEDRAARYLRKFHPWYFARLGLEPAGRLRDCQDALQRAATIDEQRAVLDGLNALVPA
jgi:tRNA-dihydrouridine synthase